jgi:putative inorganic carbon (HCO3(-)) transporter
MPARLQLKWFYGLSIVFLLGILIGLALQQYYVAAAPLVFLTLWIVVVRTDYILYFLAFITPLSVPIDELAGNLGISLPTEPLIMLLFVGFIFKMLHGQRLDRSFLKNPLSWLLFLNGLWLIITSITSTHPLISFKYTLNYFWYVSVMYFLLGHLFKSKKAIKTFIWCLILGTSILVLYTLFNHALEGFSRKYSYTAMRPFIPDHGMYGAAIAFMIPVALVFFLHGLFMRFKPTSILVALILLTIIVVGVIFSFTRAAWLSLAVAIAFYFLLTFLRMRFRSLVVLGTLGLIVLYFLQSTILVELSRNKQDSDDDIEDHVKSVSNVSTDPSNLERLNRFSCAYRMWLDKPLLGFGPGTYTFEYAPYQISSEMSIISTHAGDLGNVHSEYLRPLAESGAIGALFILLIAILIVQQGFYVFYHAPDPETKFLALAVLLGLITYVVHGFINNYSEFDKIAVPFYGFMSILSALKAYHLRPSDE